MLLSWAYKNKAFAELNTVKYSRCMGSSKFVNHLLKKLIRCYSYLGTIDAKLSFDYSLNIYSGSQYPERALETDFVYLSS